MFFKIRIFLLTGLFLSGNLLGSTSSSEDTPSSRSSSWTLAGAIGTVATIAYAIYYKLTYDARMHDQGFDPSKGFGGTDSKRSRKGSDKGAATPLILDSANSGSQLAVRPTTTPDSDLLAQSLTLKLPGIPVQEQILANQDLQESLDQVPGQEGPTNVELVYVNSNEVAGNTFENLSTIDNNPDANTVVGVGGFDVLNMAIQRRNQITTIIVLDIHPPTIHFWQRILAIVRAEPNRDLALQRIATYIAEDAVTLFGDRVGSAFASKRLARRVRITMEELSKVLNAGTFGPTAHDEIKRMIDDAAKTIIETLQNQIQLSSHWLHSQATYDFIRQIALNNHLLIRRMDITNTVSMSAFQAFLAQHQLVIDTFYVSNVAYVMPPQTLIPFFRNLAALIRNNAGFSIVYSFKKTKNDTLFKKQILIFGQTSRHKAELDLAAIIVKKIYSNF